MKTKLSHLLIFSGVLIASSAARGQPQAATKKPGRMTSPIVTASKAKQHVGRVATVCGKVVGARYMASGRGSPTFLNFEKPYPNQPFVVVIWGGDRAKFKQPEKNYKGKEICATGKVETYRGKPQIVVRDPEQVQAKEMILKGKKILQD